jgi:hypothetical protein
MSAHEPATRPCPYCKETINAESARRPHCRASLVAGLPTSGPEAAYEQGAAPRRRYRRIGSERAGVTWAALQGLEPVDPQPRLAECPGAILDSSPDGSGVGVWVLVESDATTCTYEYAGGIA